MGKLTDMKYAAVEARSSDEIDGYLMDALIKATAANLGMAYSEALEALTLTAAYDVPDGTVGQVIARMLETRSGDVAKTLAAVDADGAFLLGRHAAAKKIDDRLPDAKVNGQGQILLSDPAVAGRIMADPVTRAERWARAKTTGWSATESEFHELDQAQAAGGVDYAASLEREALIRTLTHEAERDVFVLAAESGNLDLEPFTMGNVTISVEQQLLLLESTTVELYGGKPSESPLLLDALRQATPASARPARSVPASARDELDERFRILGEDVREAQASLAEIVREIEQANPHLRTGVKMLSTVADVATASNGAPQSRTVVAKFGTYQDKRYGSFDITPAMADAWSSNLTKVSGGRVAIDFDHSPEKKGTTEAAGWITGLDHDDKFVYADVEWTPVGKSAIQDKRYLYVSPTYAENHTDETGEKHSNVLHGMALTNRPVLRKGMPTLNLSTRDLDQD